MHAVVVVCDSMHPGLIGCLGNEWIATPHLDRLAFEGFCFDQCFPENPGGGSWLRAVVDRLLPRTIARSDFSRAFFSNGDRSREPEGFDLARYFSDPELSAARMASEAEVAACAEFRLPPEGHRLRTACIERHRRQLGRRLHDRAAPRSIDLCLEGAANWIAERRGRPSLAFVDASLSGAEWLPPADAVAACKEEDETPIHDPAPSLVGEIVSADELAGVRAAYAAKIVHFDGLLGGLRNALRESGVWDECLLIVTADQGWPLGEHGFLGPSRPWLYEERDHVPLLVRLPGARAGGRGAALVQAADLGPTLADYFSLPDSQDPESWAKSWMPLLRGERPATRDYVCSECADAEFAIRTREWKLILPVAPDGEAPPRPRELYAKPEDRWEADDVAERHPDVADALELQLRRHGDAVRRGTVRFLPTLKIGPSA